MLIAEARGGSHQVAHVDLAAAAEHDAVAVEDQHRAVSFESPLDLARRRAVVDLVERGPIAVLLELHGGVATDVEGVPIEDRLIGRLLDRDQRLAVGIGLHRPLGVDEQRLAIRADHHIQAVAAQTVMDRLRPRAGVIAGSGLRRLLRGNCGDAGVEGLKGALQLLTKRLLLGQRRRRSRRRRARACAAIGLRHALGGKPTRTERMGLRRVGTAGKHQQCDHMGQGFKAQHRLTGSGRHVGSAVGRQLQTGTHHLQVLLTGQANDGRANTARARVVVIA